MYEDKYLPKSIYVMGYWYAQYFSPLGVVIQMLS